MDTTQYGQGLSKTIDDLLDEVGPRPAPSQRVEGTLWQIACCVCVDVQQQSSWTIPMLLLPWMPGWSTLRHNLPSRTLVPLTRCHRNRPALPLAWRLHPSPVMCILVACFVCGPQVTKQESVLGIEAGRALRIVNVLSVHILNSNGKVSAASAARGAEGRGGGRGRGGAGLRGVGRGVAGPRGALAAITVSTAVGLTRPCA